MHLRVHNSGASLNICRQMALFEIVQTLILRFANMEKWINSLNLSTLIFRTLQYIYIYIYIYMYVCVCIISYQLFWSMIQLISRNQRAVSPSAAPHTPKQ